MKKRMLSLLCVLALCLGLLPTAALAAAPIGQVIYVGNENVTRGGYWTTDSDGNVTAFTGEGTPADNFIYYDASRNTLTLHNATIRMSVSIDTNTLLAGAAIGVLNQYGDGNAELTISLVGTNTIAEVGKGIYVLANSTGGATLTITGDGSLNASASQTGILVQSNGNNAALCVENAEVTASVDGAFNDGVLVQAKDGSDVSLTVNGGSLTASVNANISFQFGTGTSGSGTPTVTVSNNAIVRANGGIANNSSTSIQYGTGNEENGGIVFDGSAGTVYGKVELQEDLEIGEGESLTIPEGASLTVPDGKTLTNNGTVTTTGSGSLTNNGTINNSGTLPDSIEGSQPPKITTTSLFNGEVDKNYSQALASDNKPTNWSITSGSLPGGLTLNESTGEISGTPTSAGTSTFTVTATNASGSDSKEYTIQIAAKSDTTPPTLTAGTVNRTSDKDATVTFNSNEAGTYFYNVVDSGASEPTDITSSTSYTLNSDTNPITLTDLTAGAKDIYIVAQDASKNQSTPLKMEIPAYVEPVYSISADTTPLDFGSVYTGYIQPAAKTVTITNTGNQTLNLNQPASTNSFEVGTLFDAPLAPGEKATFTVQPKAGLAAGVYREEIQVSGSGNVTLSIPVSFSVQAAAAPQVTPAPAATPAPSDNITYYTCPSCGYHNWTATDAGYRCDHCGYLESTRQLSGYGNVKGTYTPGSGATSTAASAVPQTGDESNPVLWTVLLLVSGLALGGLAIAKRKKQQ